MECAPTVNFMYQWLVLEKDYIHVLTVEKWLNNTSMAQLNMYLWAMARIKFKEIVEWFNIYGDNILESIYRLSKSDKIPENLRARMFDELSFLFSLSIIELGSSFPLIFAHHDCISL